ncbi:MAG: hypothetical protein ACKOUR_15615 [Planctomycetota bacterium]
MKFSDFFRRPVHSVLLRPRAKSTEEGLEQEFNSLDAQREARFGHITTARMTQIMSLLNLAPDLQEQ